MFFLLSKILYFLITPIVWVIILLIGAIWTKQAKWKKRLQWTSLGLLLFFSNPLIYNIFVDWWEVDTITANDIDTPYDVAILLGGFRSDFIAKDEDRFNFGVAANRFTQTLELYRTGKVKKILLTGGSASLMQQVPSESEEAQKLLHRLNIPNEDIIVEPNARNTRENAVFTAEILSHQDTLSRYLLITSAAHLPRAKACFDKAGISYTPYAVDYHTQIMRWDFSFILQPSADILEKWARLIKEWVGYVVYRLVGYV